LVPGFQGNNFCGFETFLATVRARLAGLHPDVAFAHPGYGVTAVIPRESGVSSTPRPIASTIISSGILDHPPSRVMTVEGVACNDRIWIQFLKQPCSQPQFRDLAAYSARGLL
jgi:hypothetical protein